MSNKNNHTINNDYFTIDTTLNESWPPETLIKEDSYNLGDNMSTITLNGALGSDQFPYDVTYSSSSDYIYPYVINTNLDSGDLRITGDAEFHGEVKIKGRSILETLDAIEKRLAILRPDPKKLAKFEALQKAYEHYKTLEALCDLPDDDKDAT